MDEDKEPRPSIFVEETTESLFFFLIDIYIKHYYSIQMFSWQNSDTIIMSDEKDKNKMENSIQKKKKQKGSRDSGFLG